MGRTWAVSAALLAASTYACLYVAALVPLPIWAGASAARFDQRGDPPFVLLHLLVYFVDLTAREAYFRESHGWEWLPRLVLLVALVFATYLATRAVDWPRVVVVQAGAVLLAAGVADLVGLAVVLVRSDAVGDLAVDLARSGIFWTYDALFFGFLCAATVVVGACLLRLSWTATGRRSDALAPETGGGPGRTGNLALACVLPVVALALLGGASSYSGKSEQEVRLADEVAGVVLHPRLQLRPQDDPEAGFGEVVGADRWVPGSLVAVLSLVVLWVLLRWVLAGVRTTAGPAAVLIAVWGVVVVASTVGGVVDALAFPLSSFAVPHATRFGVLWGWLPAVIAVIGLRRRAA
ncbi:hypothetical protein ACFFQW_33420 [Umezawaea endophytica]|uniref:Uncharacterized protein n=1 Tax=Umezawaea endophytica TaxID=1654476 RepID=A0A9X2VQS4_9PSEU|nr:hypothetical protein [Umezawaea endophytica]MCS7480472.1 hypothetical protein [Umezawaea endophytica]